MNPTTFTESRNSPLNHRRGLSLSLSLNALPNSKDDDNDNNTNLDLFSKSRRTLSVAADSDIVSVKLGRLSFGSAKQVKRSGLDDLLSSADGGKHDYDWLLTPPGTPLVPSADENESQSGLMAPRSGPLIRPISTTKASRLSVSQSESNHAAKQTRSSSVTRSSVSNSQYSSYSNKSTSILNTSSTSVSSYIRPSTPTNRSSSITRPSTPSRPSVSRSTTPSRPRPAHSTSSLDKTRPSQNSRPSTPTSRPQISANLNVPASRTTSRPSTPTSRPQISANLNAPAVRTTSRPSTPTRRNPAPSLSPVSGPSTPGGRSLTNGRNASSISRPSSPGPRVQAPPKPIVLPDFPRDTPPNLRTSLPDRPISAGRSRPGLALTGRGNVEPTTNTATVPRRQQSPVVTRGRLAEPTGRGRALANGQHTDAIDSRRELTTRKPVKTSTDSTGFGRTISKKSLDMAMRHMDIRNGSNGFRPLTGSNLFPQSIRSAKQKSPASVNGSLSISSNDAISEHRNHNNRFSDSGSEEDKSQSSAKLTNIDIYESSRYDMILLKEDMKNTNWLHSIDDKSDQESIFDNGFELLPEPFDPL